MREVLRQKKRNVSRAEAELAAALDTVQHAEFAVMDAKDEAKFAFLAGRRVEHVLRLFEARGCPSQDADFATAYASALIWEQGNSTTAKVETLVAAKFALLDIPSIVRDAPPLTGAAAGQLVKLTFCEWKNYNLFMLRPIDATEEDLKMYRRERNRMRMKGRTGKTEEERRSDDAEFVGMLCDLAKLHGKSVHTIRRWIKAGRIEVPEKCKSRVRKNIVSYTHTGIAKSKAADERPTAAPSPSAGHDVVAVSRLGLGPGAPRFANLPQIMQARMSLISDAARAAPRVIENRLRDTATALRLFSGAA